MSVDKKAERKSKEKQKAFERLISLPSEQHETRLAELAKRFDEDVAAIRDDFTVFVGMESRAASTDPWNVEPWPDPAQKLCRRRSVVRDARSEQGLGALGHRRIFPGTGPEIHCPFRPAFSLATSLTCWVRVSVPGWQALSLRLIINQRCIRTRSPDCNLKARRASMQIMRCNVIEAITKRGFTLMSKSWINRLGAALSSAGCQDLPVKTAS